MLVPLFVAGDELHVVLTRRRETLRQHAGQIAFPGGRRDPGDADLWATALREAREEIGLDPARVELLGALRPTPTMVTDYAVYPFVGLIEPGTAWALAEDEVAAVLEPSLRALRDGYARRPVVRRGVTWVTETYAVGDDVVWGATARMLEDLLERLDGS